VSVADEGAADARKEAARLRGELAQAAAGLAAAEKALGQLKAVICELKRFEDALESLPSRVARGVGVDYDGGVAPFVDGDFIARPVGEVRARFGALVRMLRRELEAKVAKAAEKEQQVKEMAARQKELAVRGGGRGLKMC
jgi:hypothetical protein